MRCRRPSPVAMRPSRRSSRQAGLRPSPVVNTRASSAPTPAAIDRELSPTALFGSIHGFKRREYFVHMNMKIAAHDVENFDDERIAHRVENLIAGLTIDQNILRPQYGEVLRGISLLDTEALDQTAGR